MIDSADEFRRLRTSENHQEQRRAALEPTTEEIWIEVIERFPEMREWVAINKTVPVSILRVLASDADARVRSTVAMKRKLNRELFETLARDLDDSVRHQIVWNPKVPADLLALLAQDSVEFVASSARERILRNEDQGR